MRDSSIVVLSGGLDSLASFYWAYHHTDIVMAVTFNYGQKAAAREIQASQNICKKYDVKHQVIDLKWYSQLNQSSLIDAAAHVPMLTEEELDQQKAVEQSAKSVWVPNRNGVFLNVAASIAEHWLATFIVVGFNAEEATTFPDNSVDFIKATNDCFKFSTRGAVTVYAPMATLTKKEIVQMCLKNNIDLSLLWSCYHGESKMCGQCESCLRLKRALKQAKDEKWAPLLF